MYSPSAYDALIFLLQQKGYRFASFLDSATAPEEKVVYLRHDVDFSPVWATNIARLNRHRGVSATFCFLLRSPLYNLAAPETLAEIEAITSCGQHIALHFAFASTPGADLQEIAGLVLRDYEVARRIVPTMAPVFSWHNPSFAPGLIDRCLDLEVPGMTNIYSRRFIHDAVYKADSNYRYSVEQWSAIACAEHRRMQLLFHPCQWMAGARDVREVLAKTFAQIMREHEREFIKSEVFLELHPSGLSEEIFRMIADAVLAGGHK